MKKSFKTIMALVSMLAISMSGMSMTSAYKDPTPPQSPMTVNGDPATGEFNAVDPIPVTMSTEHLLSVTIDFGDMKFTYSVKEDKFDENCFNGKNNKLTITNYSTCPINYAVVCNIAELDLEPVLTNETGLLSYAGDYGSVEFTITNTDELADMHNYQFNNAKIGEFTVSLEPDLETIPTEERYYVKLTFVPESSGMVNTYLVLGNFGYSEEAANIIETVHSGTPYYLGPYETENEAQELYMALSQNGCTCSIINGDD